MTNEIRSVIDNKIKVCKGIYGFFPKDDHTNDQELCVKVELVELLMKEGLEEFLDAIIEELEQDKMNLFNTIKQPFDFDKGMMEALRNTLNKLKQAREELSTSLTQ